MTMLDVRSLVAMQDGFRASRARRAAMDAYVRAGGRYCCDFDAQAVHGPQPRIAIECTPDGARYIADGLHRVISILVARTPPVLYEAEYFLKHVTYEMYSDIDLDGGWFTPFDPRVEVRCADLSSFKQVVRDIMAASRDPSVYIRSHRALYCRARTPDDTLAMLATRWQRLGSP